MNVYSRRKISTALMLPSKIMVDETAVDMMVIASIDVFWKCARVAWELCGVAAEAKENYNARWKAIRRTGTSSNRNTTYCSSCPRARRAKGSRCGQILKPLEA